MILPGAFAGFGEGRRFGATELGVQLRFTFATTTTGPDGFVSVTLGAATPAGVPEPANWAMMIGGLGLAGAASRRRTRRATAVHA